MSWTIKDALFYPLGLFNNASRNKTIFVTWSYDTLLTFIFKKSGNANSLKDTYKILLQETIDDIIVTDCNTLTLTKGGHVYYFSSCRSLRRLEPVEGVRCMCSTANGFAIIKVTKENRIVLETYRDFSDVSEIGRDKQNFDISFDDANLLNSCWKDETFSILTIPIDAENKQFFELLAKAPLVGAELFLFSINNSVFGLHGDGSGDDFSIFVVLSVPSEIKSIHYLKGQNIILIFMKCGVLEMIFHSKLTKQLDRAVHVIGGDITASTIANDCFFYSDDERVIKCTLTYDNSRYTIDVETFEKRIRGIVAITWVPTMRKLICLSENNIFYRVKFDEKADACEDNDDFMELNEETINEVETHFTRLLNLIEEPKRIREQIMIECHKQELIAVYKRKEMYQDLVEFEVNFQKTISDFNGITIYPIAEQPLTKKTYFALVDVQVKDNPIFKTGLWRLSIELLGERYIYKSVIVNNSILEQSVRIVLQMQKRNILIMPEIRVTLTTHVKMGFDFIYLSIPAKIHNENYDKLFTARPTTMVDPAEKTVDEKMRACTNQSECDNLRFKFSSKLKAPLLVNLEDIYEMFGVPIVQSNDNLPNRFVIFMLTEEIHVEYIEVENVIEIVSYDPGALYYVKRFLAKKLYSATYNEEKMTLDEAAHALQKLRSEISVKDYELLDAKTLANSLQKIYAVLRKGVLTRI